MALKGIVFNGETLKVPQEYIKNVKVSKNSIVFTYSDDSTQTFTQQPTVVDSKLNTTSKNPVENGVITNALDSAIDSITNETIPNAFTLYNDSEVDVDGKKNFKEIGLTREISTTIEKTYPVAEYSIENVSTDYGFVLNDTGYYESNNNGVDNSYALCKLSFVMSEIGDLDFEVIDYAESNYDFGIFSNIDTTLASSNSADSTNVYKSYKGLSSSSTQTLTYSNIPVGEHYIEIKYRKDSSSSQSNDSLQFKVTSNVGKYTAVETIRQYNNLKTNDNDDLLFIGKKVAMDSDVETQLQNKFNTTGGTITGDVNIQGNVTVTGETTIEKTKDLEVENAIIYTNANKVELKTVLSGIAIYKDGTNIYGIMYDPATDSVKLGLGSVDAEGKFTFNSGEGQPVAVRSDSSLLVDGHLIKWDSATNSFVDSGKEISEDVIANSIAERTVGGALKSTPITDIDIENQTDDTVATKKDITQVKTTLNTEISNRESADITLQTNIDAKVPKTDISGVSTGVQTGIGVYSASNRLAIQQGEVSYDTEGNKTTTTNTVDVFGVGNGLTVEKFTGFSLGQKLKIDTDVVALKTDIPDSSNFVTTDTAQTISGVKDFGAGLNLPWNTGLNSVIFRGWTSPTYGAILKGYSPSGETSASGKGCITEVGDKTYTTSKVIVNNKLDSKGVIAITPTDNTLISKLNDDATTDYVISYKDDNFEFGNLGKGTKILGNSTRPKYETSTTEEGGVDLALTSDIPKSINNIELVANGNANIYGNNITLASDNAETLTDTITSNSGKIESIEQKIPAQATSTNQLADKDFVNSSISTATATFRGTVGSIDALPTTGVDLNDYAFVKIVDSKGNTLYNRYKYTGSEWEFEYSLNNSSFTANQWSAINSGATSDLISKISTNESAISDLQTNKADKSEIPTDYVTQTTDQSISGIKTFSNYIKTPQVASAEGKGLVRYKSTEGKSVFGNDSTASVLMGNTDRPYYSKSGSDFTGVELALESDLTNKLEASNIKAGTGINISTSGNDVTIDASGGLTIDSALSQTSENAVQNKVITNEINTLYATLDSANQSIDTIKSNYVTTDSGQTISGAKNFTGTFKINGGTVTYDSASDTFTI